MRWPVSSNGLAGRRDREAVSKEAPATLWLEATLYWGGKKQDSERRTLEHVYSSTPGGFF